MAGEPGPTDVMSFPIDEIRPGDEKRLPDGMRAILGDVVICPSVALKQATAAGHSLTRELLCCLHTGFFIFLDTITKVRVRGKLCLGFRRGL